MEHQSTRYRGRQRQADWVSLLQIAAMLVVFSVVYNAFKTSEHKEEEWTKVVSWLAGQGLGDKHLYHALQESGVTSMKKLPDILVKDYQAFDNLAHEKRLLLHTAILLYQDPTIVDIWLTEHGLGHYIESVHKAGFHSLEDLRTITDVQLQSITSPDYTLSDYMNFHQSLSQLSQDAQILQQTKLRYIKQRRTAFGALTFGGVCLFVVVICTVLILTMVQQRVIRHHANSKHSILELVTGKYLAPQFCQVHWEWTEPQVVGKTVTFSIKFHQRNGRPYPISDRDNLLVEIFHGSSKVPPTVQIGGATNNDFNIVKVAFTVHRSGEYKISVLVDAKHIRGSPFTKKFLSGTLDPHKSGFVNQSSMVVCTTGVSHQLLLEPRDNYGNICDNTTEADIIDNYAITITETGTHERIHPQCSVVYDKSTRRVALSLRMFRTGCYTAVATYGGVKLKNGEFTILVLSDIESAEVNKNTSRKSHNIFYEARLVSNNYCKNTKPKKVYCYISPKQLTIKEFYLKFIPMRLFTFRVCPSTKFQFLGTNNQLQLPTFTIDDGSQPPIELAAKSRDIIAATFANYLLKNIGGSETFKDKQDFFYHEVRQHHSKRLHDSLIIKINRSFLLESSYKATKHFSTSDWCRNFEIIFQGEEGLDWGGVRREWFEVLCTSLFDPGASGLFTRFADDNTQSLVHPNHKRLPALKMKYYEFAGKIIGKCLYESSLGGGYRQLVKARFTRSFLAQLIGLRVNYKYFEQDDPDLYVSKIKYIEENDVDDMELMFAEEEYKDGKLEKVVDLIPNGSKTMVNSENKKKYLDELAQYKLTNCVREEIEAVLKGLNELIPDNLLSIFDEYELELLMCGTGNYSISEFKEHHVVCGSTAGFSKVLDWFWTVVAGFTKEEMARLLQFTTGCSQLPPGGFAELVPKFQITPSPMYGSLPTAHTCFNQLCLPDYDSLEQMHNAMLVAINEGNQGFGMV